jgi:hypothetical protein
VKISPTLSDLRHAKQPKQLPGEPRPFIPRGSVRNLVPPQQLAPDGSITSSRKHEVERSDPLLLRIRELEDEVEYWKEAYEHALKESLK